MCGPGGLAVSVSALSEGTHQPMTLRAKGQVGAYRLDPEGFREFLLRYPGIYLRLLHHAEAYELG